MFIVIDAVSVLRALIIVTTENGDTCFIDTFEMLTRFNAVGIVNTLVVPCTTDHRARRTDALEVLIIVVSTNAIGVIGALIIA